MRWVSSETMPANRGSLVAASRSRPPRMILRRVSRRRPSVAIRALGASRRALAWARRFFASSTDSGVGAVITSPRQSRTEERRGGKECVVRVDLGGRRILKKQKKKIQLEHSKIQRRLTQ